MRLRGTRAELKVVWPILLVLSLMGCQEADDERYDRPSQLQVQVIHTLEMGYEPELVQDSGGCLTADGSLVHITGDGAIYELDEETRPLLPAAKARRAVNSLACESSRFVAWIEDDVVDTVRVFDRKRNRLRQRRMPDASALAIGPRSSVLIAAGARLYLWSPASDFVLPTREVGDMYWPEDLELTRDSRYAVLVEPGGVEVWRLDPYPPTVTGFLACNCWDSGISIRTDPALGALAQGRRVRLVSLDTGKVVEVHRFHPPEPATSVVGAEPPELGIAAISPDGRYVAAGWSDPAALAVWDRQTDEEVIRKVGPGPPARISWTSKDDHLLVELGASAENDGNLLQFRVAGAEFD